MPQAQRRGKPRQNRACRRLFMRRWESLWDYLFMASHVRIADRMARRIATACCPMLLIAGLAAHAEASACLFEPQGDGRVAEIIDARSFRLDDGREIVLAGIEPVAAEQVQNGTALASIIAGREVTLRGPDDAPDRYGRQSAYVYLAGSERPVQSLLLAQGAALFSGRVAAPDCAALLTAAEAVARQARQGIWAGASAIKTAESPDDILAAIGRFTLVEGRVLSVRQAGSTTYLNFGRNWTRGFAVTIPRRVLGSFAANGIVVNSFERRRIRVRGFVEQQRGPRIEVLQVGQIEVLSGN
jgi:endonuclease YncB( thermonuclease family)